MHESMVTIKQKYQSFQQLKLDEKLDNYKHIHLLVKFIRDFRVSIMQFNQLYNEHRSNTLMLFFYTTSKESYIVMIALVV